MEVRDDIEEVPIFRLARTAEECPMAVFMVERNLKGITMTQLAAAQKRAISCSDAFATGGRKVRYIRTTFVPGEDRSMCLFEAESVNDVEQVNITAHLPYVRIIEALDLTP
jgi:hypothetical protein